jgi:hypothetical protein
MLPKARAGEGLEADGAAEEADAVGGGGHAGVRQALVEEKHVERFAGESAIFLAANELPTDGFVVGLDPRH